MSALAVIDAGVQLFEQTPMTWLDQGNSNRIRTPAGELVARQVVLRTNAELARIRQVRPHVSVFSSFASMTDPAPDHLAVLNWTGDEGIADLRTFVLYFRKTPDGCVLMGSGRRLLSGSDEADLYGRHAAQNSPPSTMTQVVNRPMQGRWRSTKVCRKRIGNFKAIANIYETDLESLTKLMAASPCSTACKGPSSSEVRLNGIDELKSFFFNGRPIMVLVVTASKDLALEVSAGMPDASPISNHERR